MCEQNLKHIEYFLLSIIRDGFAKLKNMYFPLQC